MSIQPAGASIPNQPVINTPPASPPQDQQPAQEPQDRLALEKVAKGATKVVLGAIPVLTWGTIKGAQKALQTAGDSAVKAAGVDPKSFAGVMLRFSPYVLGGLSLVLGAGPLGAAAAALSAPGAIGGTMAAINGAAEGVQVGVELARKAGDKVKGKVEPKYGEKAGHAAKIAASILSGAVTVPLFAMFGSINKSFDFACKAIGVKQPAANVKEALGNLGKTGLVTIGFLKGAVGASGVVGTILNGTQGAGGLATTITGTVGGFKGFGEGAKEAYGKVSDFVDKHWERAK